MVMLVQPIRRGREGVEHNHAKENHGVGEGRQL